MKTPEETTLNQKILDAARDEVAKSYGLESSLQYHVNLAYQTFEEIIEFESKAALLAMEKQAEFFRHIAGIGWKHEPLTDANEWYNDGAYEAELELYEIFTTQQ